MGPYHGLQRWIRIDQGVMVTKEYSTFLGSPELEPHHQMQFSVIRKTSYYPYVGVTVFFDSRQKSQFINNQLTFLINIGKILSISILHKHGNLFIWIFILVYKSLLFYKYPKDFKPSQTTKDISNEKVIYNWKKKKNQWLIFKS